MSIVKTDTTRGDVVACERVWESGYTEIGFYTPETINGGGPVLRAVVRGQGDMWSLSSSRTFSPPVNISIMQESKDKAVDAAFRHAQADHSAAVADIRAAA